eukprot:1144773-Pelagomonas_calceolata.AAC.2
MSKIVHIDVGSASRLAQHDLHTFLSKSLIVQYLHTSFEPPRNTGPVVICHSTYALNTSSPDQARRNSSRPDTILATPCPTNLNRPITAPSHQELRSMRGNEEIRSTIPARLMRSAALVGRYSDVTLAYLKSK